MYLCEFWLSVRLHSLISIATGKLVISKTQSIECRMLMEVFNTYLSKPPTINSCLNYKNYIKITYPYYSWKILRAPIFENFHLENFTLKIFISQ